eukprot:SAG31_NODE_734_length_12489_cov_6.922034_10_plen_119_part_00
MTPVRIVVTVLKFFEEMLDMGSGKALVGTQLTYCDLALWLHLDQLGEADAFPEWAEWLELDQLRSFHLRISRLPLVRKYMTVRLAFIACCMHRCIWLSHLVISIVLLGSRTDACHGQF